MSYRWDRTHTPSAVEQTDLIATMEAGLCAAAARRGDLSTDATDTELEALIEAGRRARERLLTGHLGLVFLVANRTARRETDMDRQELVQEGFLGLVQALERFDPHQGTRFSSYALPWIRAAVDEAVGAQDGWSAHVAKGRRRLWYAQSALTQELGRSASVTELAERSGRSVTWVSEMMQRGGSVPLAELPGLDLVAEESDPEPEQPVRQWLSGLSPLQRKVIEGRFGLAGADPMSLYALADQLGMSRSSVARVEQAALTELRLLVQESDVTVPHRMAA